MILPCLNLLVSHLDLVKQSLTQLAKPKLVVLFVVDIAVVFLFYSFWVQEWSIKVYLTFHEDTVVFIVIAVVDVVVVILVIPVVAMQAWSVGIHLRLLKVGAEAGGSG